MQVTQLAKLVNDTVGELDGTNELLKEDLSNVVDVGNEIFNTDNVDNYVKKLIDRIGKTVFNNRVYQGTAPSVLMDSWEFGSVLERVDAETPEAQDDPAWNLQDGQDYSDDIFYQPKVTARFFNSKIAFEIPISFALMQVKESFNSAQDLNGFVSMLQTKVQNGLNLRIDNLISKTINNMTAQVINANKGLQVVNLLSLYNANATEKVTAQNALQNEDFIKFANLTINTYQSRLQKMSTLFNVGGVQKFTPTDQQHLILLDSLASASRVYLESNTYNQDKVELQGSYDTVPYWQGSGKSYSFNDTSSIDIAIKDGTKTKEVKQAGIVAVLFDRLALGVACANPHTTTSTNAHGEFYTNYNKYSAMYFNDLNENYVVFTIVDDTQATE